jgi:hypothetical protein
VSLLSVLLLSAALYMPFCAVAHLCGCAWPWSGADVQCNVHAASGPHCPWCQHWALGAAAALLIGGGQVVVFRLLRGRGFSAPSAGLGAALSFVVIAPLAATLLWLPTDYPHFFGGDARSRLGIPAGPVRCGAPTPRGG